MSRPPGRLLAAETLPGGTRVLRIAELADVPGLTAGITLRPDDFGLASEAPAWEVAERYGALAADLGFSGVAVCRQVHGARLVAASAAPPAGLWIAGEADGFAGRADARLFGITVADCVPVWLVDPESRHFALVHAGWRGAAAGILGRAVGALREASGRPTAGLRMHLGPSICGDCYEVGPEVPRAFGHEATGTTTFDLAAALAAEAHDAGIAREHVSRSDLCTLCEGETLHSFRGAGKRAGRMVAWLGWHAC